LTLPHLLKRIHLQLARSKEFPMGSRRRGYEFVAPLDAAGHIDPRLWHQYRDHCRVRRFWEGEDEQVGRLVHKPGGAEHARWVFDYDAERDDDDEAGYRFGSHTFTLGEYVSIRARCTPFRWRRCSRRRNWDRWISRARPPARGLEFL
jgi:hypothetical protein